MYFPFIPGFFEYFPFGIFNFFMINYFKLQTKLLNRKLLDSGVHPGLVYVLFILVFIGFSELVFQKINHASYLYLCIPLAMILKLSDTRRNEFLKINFSENSYLQLRICENVLLLLPFLIFLLYKSEYIPGVILSGLGVWAALKNFKTAFELYIPHPFYKRPFEFAVGFRNTFYLVLIGYVLAGIAAAVGNFNLGIAIIIVFFMLMLGYLGNPENEYYVWTYSKNPKDFLVEKMKISLRHATLICLPVLILLLIFFFSKALIVIGLLGIGYLYLLAFLLLKYSAYPREINLLQGILFAFCILFPFLLIGLIPFLYKQSLKRLNDFLQ